jgi:hypothetical protein
VLESVTPSEIFSFFEYFFNYPAAVSLLLAARKMLAKSGCAGAAFCCADYRCGHRCSGEHWPDDLLLSDIEPRFVRQACRKRGADVRSDFNWNRKQVSVMGYRRAFHVSIPLPDGHMLRTPRDAGDYIHSLPGAKHSKRQAVTVQVL